MIILPYSTALTLARPPVITFATILICFLVLNFQELFPITEGLMYYPDSWNPVKMLTSSLAHADWMHLIGNMIFYIAFAPALEVLIANKLRYIWIMFFISFVVSVSYSISVFIGSMEPWPTLGFSGVVMGMIGLSAYLMPKAKIRVFWWYIVFWKTFYVPAWVLAIAYIGLDTWEMLTANDFGEINVVAHVAGGFAGYLYGYFWLSDRKEETQEELAEEIATMKMEKQFGNSPAMSFRGRKELHRQHIQRMEAKEHDRYMGRVYQKVTAHLDSDAIYLLMEKYDYLRMQTPEFEALFDRIEEWGASRTLLCIGRLVIYKLDREKRYGRAIVYIEKCQNISPQFILPELSRTIFYAKLAIESGKPQVAKNLIDSPEKRYGEMVDIALCEKLTQAVGLA